MSTLYLIFRRLLQVPLIAAAAWCQQLPVAFTGARIIPISGPEIPSGTLLVENGKITAVGASVNIPPNARHVDASGKVIMPGLVDSHSHIGSPEGGDSSAPIQPDARVLDSINVRDARIQKAQAGGITVANVMPGSGHLLSGQTLYLKLRDGRTIDDMLIRLPDGRLPDGRIAGGIKMANGTNSRRQSGPFPGTRAKSAALVREQYIKAQEYRDKVRRANGDPEKMPARDLRMEALVEALDGKRTVQHHTHRHDDILTVLRIAKEFNLRVVLHHVSDAWAVADEIAKAGVPASILLLDSPGGKIEAKDVRFENAAALEKAGIVTGFHTDDGVSDSRLFLRQGGLAVRGGMSREKALYGLTMANARILELDNRIGSLDPGKDADFIVLSGDPLSVYRKVLETWVDGVKVFDRTNLKDLLYATGGEGASHDQGALLHEEELER
ncbi:MAG: amidohydrolase family protein [Bryobacteraceae bacterium]